MCLVLETQRVAQRCQEAGALGVEPGRKEVQLGEEIELFRETAKHGRMDCPVGSVVERKLPRPCVGWHLHTWDPFRKELHVNVETSLQRGLDDRGDLSLPAAHLANVGDNRSVVLLDGDLQGV